MKSIRLALLIYLVTTVLPAKAADNPTAEKPSQTFLQWAPTPPMGWNSWDCYGAAVN